MIYDFLAVPRTQGKYTIPAVEFTYFDTATNTYKTIKTQSFTINVDKGDGTSASVEDYNAKDNDIHPIKTDNSHSGDGAFFGSTLYWVCLFLPLIAFVTLLIIFRKRALAYADVVGMRGKNANKVATKHLKIANKLMSQGRQNEFYDEVLRALWGYVGDKLNMPVEHLSRENISGNLSRQGVDDETINKFVEALDECEYERYAPGDAAGNMNKTYNTAMTTISDIENSIKSNKKSKKMVVIFLLMMLIPTPFFAVTKAQTDNAYKRENYQQAIKGYKELLRNNANSTLYYNLGNAYYRSDSITKAVIAYERALKLSPSDADIRFNLQFARSKTIDKIMPASEMFFVTWYYSLVNSISVNSWAITAITSIILVLIFVLIYLFSSKLILRKVSFFGAVGLFLLFLLANLFAYTQKQQMANSETAVVISPSVTVKKTPSVNATNAFVIHEGTHLNITDKTINNWRGVTLDDGREGWIQTNAIEEI